MAAKNNVVQMKDAARNAGRKPAAPAWLLPASAAGASAGDRYRAANGYQETGGYRAASGHRAVAGYPAAAGYRTASGAQTAVRHRTADGRPALSRYPTVGARRSPSRALYRRPAAQAARLHRGVPDMMLFLIVLALAGIGVIMVFSASYYDTLSADPYMYLKRQGAFAGIGIAACLTAMNVDYRRYRFLGKPLLYLTIGLLAFVFACPPVEEVHRWIPLGIINLQPSEVAKFSLALFMADRLSRKKADPNALRGELGRILAFLGIILLLIYKEPDLGTTVAVAGIAAVILIAAGMHWAYVGAAGVLGIAGVAALVMSNPYQMSRIMGYLDPWADPVGGGYQVINSYLALGSGGFWGVGISGSRQKLGFLPEQFTDFIFSIIGEELGFIGAGLVVLLFLLLAWRGYLIAMRCPDFCGCLLAVGITTAIVLQAALNLGVVTGVLPVTGISLPFISHGGSSLLMSLGSVGVLLNISRYRSVNA